MNLLTKRWWTMTVRGVFAVLFGIAAIVWPAITLLVLFTLFGIYMLADGAMSIIVAIEAAANQARWWPFVVESLIEIGIGLAVFLTPAITALTLLYFIAAWAVLAGLFRFFVAVELRHEISNEWLMGLNGVVSILFGLVIFAVPAISLVALAIVIGIFSLFSGITSIMLSFRLRDWQEMNLPSEKKLKRAA